MAIHPDLLEILACPLCKTRVELVKEGQGLKCGKCFRVYPVRDDIPIMLVDEATIEEPDTKSAT
ncbi:MAG: Trm112 family protein [Acidobacteriota bacterium]